MMILMRWSESKADGKCLVCGGPAFSKWRICQRSPECKRAYYHARKVDPEIREHERTRARERARTVRRDRRAYSAERHARVLHDPVLYGVDLGHGRAKVGTTTSIDSLLKQYRRVVPEAQLIWSAPGGYEEEHFFLKALPREGRVIRPCDGKLSDVFALNLPLSGARTLLAETYKLV